MVAKYFTIKTIIKIVLLLGALGFGLWLFLPKGDEAAIKEQLGKLSSLGSKSSEEKTIATALKVNSTDKVFAEKFAVSVGHDMFSGEYTPRELTANLTRFHTVFKSVKTTTSDVIVEILSPTKAEVEFVGQLVGTTKDNKYISEVRDLKCYFTKKDNLWLIDKLEIREIIQK